jgi:hypothetical protein
VVLQSSISWQIFHAIGKTVLVGNEHLLEKLSLLCGLARVVAENPTISFITLKARESLFI